MKGPVLRICGHTPFAKGNMGGSGPSCHKCAKGHLSDCPPGFCWPHRKSGLESVLMLSSPGLTDTNVKGINQQETEKRGR